MGQLHYREVVVLENIRLGHDTKQKWGQPYTRVGFHLRRYGQQYPAVLGIRLQTDHENPPNSGSGIVRRIDLLGAYIELAQPDGRIVGIESHGTARGQKAKTMLPSHAGAGVKFGLGELAYKYSRSIWSGDIFLGNDDILK